MVSLFLKNTYVSIILLVFKRFNFFYRCEPCKILTPKLIEILEPEETVDLAIVDVDENVDLVHTFEVKAVPAVLGFKNGVVVDKFIGLVDSEMIEHLIAQLNSNKSIS